MTRITVLMSDKQECFIEGISGVVHRVAGDKATVLAYTPETNDELDVFKTALRHHWDLAILFLNNISYASGIFQILRAAGHVEALLGLTSPHQVRDESAASNLQEELLNLRLTA